MILSENSIEHALLTFGALRAGAAAVPVSPTYSFGSDLERLGYALELIEPGLVYAKDAKRYARALSCAAAPERRVVTEKVSLSCCATSMRQRSRRAARKLAATRSRRSC